MKTMEPDAPTSHISARCKASTPGGTVADGNELSATAAYPITHSQLTEHNASNGVRALAVLMESEPRSRFLFRRVLFTRTGTHFARKRSSRRSRSWSEVPAA